MPRKRKPISKAEKLARTKLKAIRKYLTAEVKRGFKKDQLLSAYQRRKIGKLHKLVSALTVRPHIVYTSKNKKRLRAVQHFAQHGPKSSGLKVAFVPVADPQAKVKISKGGEIHTETRYIKTRSIFFNQRKLIKDPAMEVARAVAKAIGATHFQIMAGEYLIAGVTYRNDKGGIRALQAKVESLMNQYGNSKTWLVGLKAFTFKNQKQKTEYVKRYRKARKEIAQARKKVAHPKHVRLRRRLV